MKTLSVKKTEFGNGVYAPVVTLKPASAEALLCEAKQALCFAPAAVEWRMDYFNPMVDADFSTRIILQALRQLAALLGDTPLILTFRKKSEAYDPNLRFHSDQMRRRTIRACLETGLVDLIDIEMNAESALRTDVMTWAGASDTKVIYSYHQYNQAVESEKTVLEALFRAEKLGADMVRCAYMAWSNEEVIRIGRAAREAKKTLNIPMCCYAMGDVGSISRVLGDRYGADFCFFSLNGADGGVDERIEEYQKIRSSLRA